MECSVETYSINTNKLLTETEEKHGNLNRDFRPWNPQMTKRFFMIFGKKKFGSPPEVGLIALISINSLHILVGTSHNWQHS